MVFWKRKQRDDLIEACDSVILWALENAMLTRNDRKLLMYRRRTYGWNFRMPHPPRPPWTEEDDVYV